MDDLSKLINIDDYPVQGGSSNNGGAKQDGNLQ